jgi:nucleoside-diphosphate-sugar epimerase
MNGFDPSIEEDALGRSNESYSFLNLYDSVVVLGAGGMLGSYVLETLLVANYRRSHKVQLLAYTRFLPEHLKKIVNNNNSAFSATSREEDLRTFVRQSESILVINAAGHSNSGTANENVEELLNSNLLLNKKILEDSHGKLVRLVYFSSGEVYGEDAPTPTGEKFISQLSHLDGRSLYRQVKKLGESYLDSWVQQNRNEVHRVTILRIFHTFGPGVSRHDKRFLAELIDCATTGSDLVLRSSGDIRRSLLYASDLFDAIVRSDSSERLQEFNVGGDTAFRIRYLAELAGGTFGFRVVSRPSSEADLRGNKQVGLPDLTKLRSVGWEAQVSIMDGLSRAVRSRKWRDEKGQNIDYFY